MFIVFFRAVILYAVIIFSMRLMGKRQLGELQPSELVITILMSNIATLPVEDISIPMIMGIVPIFTLVCLDVILSHLSLKFRKLRRIISGSPKIIIKDGVIDQKMLRDLRFSIDDLLESLRELQIFDIDTVQLAVVETTGKISVYQKKEFQPISGSDIGKYAYTVNPPQLIIDEGTVVNNALKFIKKDRSWLDSQLHIEKVKAEDVFFMTADETGKYTLIRKDDSA